MTKTQMTAVLEEFGLTDKVGTISPLTELNGFVVSKEEVLQCDPKRYRYKIDLDNMILSRYLVKAYSVSADESKLEYPTSGVTDKLYDSETGLYTVYQYFCENNSTKLVSDDYDIGMVSEVIPPLAYVVTQEAVA
jgi:hypothetical protein